MNESEIVNILQSPRDESVWKNFKGCNIEAGLTILAKYFNIVDGFPTGANDVLLITNPEAMSAVDISKEDVEMLRDLRWIFDIRYDGVGTYLDMKPGTKSKFKIQSVRGVHITESHGADNCDCKDCLIDKINKEFKVENGCLKRK